MTKKKISTIIIGVVVSSILFFFPSITYVLNFNIESIFYSIQGKAKPDPNIILINISASDIENFGDWPLKRSYYALLIDNLTKLNVKRIGIEIFLSENIASQNIYNNVLNQSIRKSGKVVLASLADNLFYNKGKIFAENIIYPNPTKEIDSIQTGHINFLIENGILIPSQINTNKDKEFSFIKQLSENYRDSSNLKVNFLFSWRSFKSYSMLDFFEMLELSDERLKSFQNKIILIGVSDPMIAKSIRSYYDENIPGLGIHAIALDNILNDRSLNYEFIDVSKIIFFFIIIFIAFSNLRNFMLLSILVFLFILLFVLWHLFYLQLNYSFLLLPVISYLVFSFIYEALQSKQKLKDTLNESAILQRNLLVKEEKLQQLKLELVNKAAEPSFGLEIKISELEKEIETLKLTDQQDKEEFKTSSKQKIFEGIVYKSGKMEKVVSLVKKVAPEDATVLIFGESGTGKELIANAIHNLSKRSNTNFVVVNCAALPDTLLESELFGHVKGAFTDAVRDKMGRFEEANNGTLFLDEIGETSENFQLKLLRVLQSGDFQKVGSSKTEHVNVRIVAATNKNLHKLVREGEFREDLYYRLNVINIELPNLNDRNEDIEILAEYFASREDSEIKFSKAVMNKLIDNEWKGNVRELESVIKHALIFTKSENRKIIKLKDLPENLSKHDKDDLEKLIIESLREKEFSHSSINETAMELGGLSRTIVSENFRGMFFRSFTQNNFDLKKSVIQLSNSDSEEINSKVESKVTTYLANIKKDLSEITAKSFEEVKIIFSSKYKNLPQKYHIYLDLIIKYLIQK